MAELIESERLVFEAGSVEARAFALMHAHGAGAGEAKCALCLLAWLARALAVPGQGVGDIAAEACAVAQQFGTVTSVGFEALLRPHDTLSRGRLDGLERALRGGGLAALPMPPREELN